jgi:hypothetical protein
VGGDDPSAVSRPDGHDAARRIDNLDAIVEMKGNDVPTGIVVFKRDDLGALVPKTIKNDLTLLRHILSQYRMHANGASASFDWTAGDKAEGCA